MNPFFFQVMVQVDHDDGDCHRKSYDEWSEYLERVDHPRVRMMNAGRG